MSIKSVWLTVVFNSEKRGLKSLRIIVDFFYFFFNSVTLCLCTLKLCFLTDTLIYHFPFTYRNCFLAQREILHYSALKSAPHPTTCGALRGSCWPWPPAASPLAPRPPGQGGGGGASSRAAAFGALQPHARLRSSFQPGSPDSHSGSQQPRARELSSLLLNLKEFFVL